MADDKTRKIKKKALSGKKSVGKESSKKKHLETAIRAQVAAEEKAHRIVEQLVLENVDQSRFLEIGNFITPSHYTDITEERALAKVCGYPLCTNPVTKLLQQKYKISMQTNRVFDITERKHFCSNQCYKASKFYESQIPTSPVWTRSVEKLKKLTLLKNSDNSSRSGAGDLLVGSECSSLNQREDDVQPAQEDLAYINDITEDLKDLSFAVTANNQTGDLMCERKQNSPQEELSKDVYSCESKAKSPTVNDFKSCSKTFTEDNLSKSNDSGMQDSDESRNLINISNTKDIFVKCIKETLKQWFTKSSFQYLNLGASGSECKVAQGKEYIPNYTEKALYFLRLDKKTNNDDYYDDDTVKTIGNVTAKDVTITEREYPEEEFPCIVPPIDSKSQLAIRRQILLQKFKQLLPDLLCSMQYNAKEAEDHFSSLVRTFKLSSDNVMFKPVEWQGLTATLLYLIQQRLHTDVTRFPSDIETNATFKHLQLTKKDMNDILDSLTDGLWRTKHASCPISSSLPQDQGAESYSVMEELD